MEEFKEYKATLRVRVWLESEKGMAFGLGRAMLLEKIHTSGSLNRAAQEMGMSYRAAWGKLKQSEEALGCQLCRKNRGRTGYTLTEQGRQLLDMFSDLHSDVEQYARKKAGQVFPWSIRPFRAS